MLTFYRCLLMLGSLWALQASPVPTLPADQAKPLRRTFHPAEEWRYRVRLTVRNELEGLETAQAGAPEKAVQHSAEVKLSWIISERVAGVAPDGTAQIQEQLEKFGAAAHSQPSDAKDAETVKLAASLDRMASEWAHDRALKFRVKPNGLATDIPTEGAPKLEESGRPLLTPWLNHALRPQATLPARPIRLGESWQEPRRVHMADWTAVQAREKDEWLETAAGEHATVRLHVVQEISGRVFEHPAGASARLREKEAGEGPPHGNSRTETFVGDSLSTLALDDGRVLAASRSARRETVRELPPVEGTSQPRRSRATLSLQVEIEPCVEKECEAGSHR